MNVIYDLNGVELLASDDFVEERYDLDDYLYEILNHQEWNFSNFAIVDISAHMCSS